MSEAHRPATTRGILDTVLAFASVLLPLVLVYLGHVYKETEAKRGLHEKYVEMAIGILDEHPEPENRELRKWALEVLHNYSEIPIHDAAQEHLLSNSLSSEQRVQSAASGTNPPR